MLREQRVFYATCAGSEMYLGGSPAVAGRFTERASHFAAPKDL